MQRGEIWLVELDPGRGSEQKKTRPAIIVSIDGIGRLPIRIVVPLTDWNDRYYTYQWMVQVINDKQNNLTKISAADCLQIRSIDTQRFIKKIGEVNPDTMEDIQATLTMILGADT
jgi:mRNA interferase MazF